MRNFLIILIGRFTFAMQSRISHSCSVGVILILPLQYIIPRWPTRTKVYQISGARSCGFPVTYRNPWA
jgi:hypothetical protein